LRRLFALIAYIGGEGKKTIIIKVYRGIIMTEGEKEKGVTILNDSTEEFETIMKREKNFLIFFNN